MDELEEKKRILLKNKDHILRMSNNKKKVEMLRGYFSLLGYHQIMTGEDFDEEIDIDDDFAEKYNRYVINDTAKKINEIEKNSEELCVKYQQIIDYYKENEFCKYDYIKYTKVNKAKMEKALWEFFESLGEDVLEIYYKMIIGKNIFLNNSFMDRLGYAMDAAPIDNACITVQNIPNYLDFYLTLAHEVGHCYQFHLQKNQRDCAMFDPYCEITSLLFEKLFMAYLKNNYLIKDNRAYDLEDHITFLNNVSISKNICKLLKNEKISIINPFNLNYTHTANVDDINKEIIDDFGYIEPFSTELELVEIHYSFGNIISRYFMNKLQKDFDNEWNNFKNFICSVNYLPMKEVIKEYFDINLVKDDIKKLTKSYRER